MYGYGYEDYGRGAGRHLHLHRHLADRCGCREYGYGRTSGRAYEGYAFGHRGIYELVPSKERLQETLAWLKEEKAELGKKIKDTEDLLNLNGRQS